MRNLTVDTSTSAARPSPRCLNRVRATYSPPTLRITINLDGTPITSKSHTHPSYSLCSRLYLVSIFRCSSPRNNPVYPRYVNSSAFLFLVFHRKRLKKKTVRKSSNKQHEEVSLTVTHSETDLDVNCLMTCSRQGSPGPDTIQIVLPSHRVLPSYYSSFDCEDCHIVDSEGQDVQITIFSTGTSLPITVYSL